MFSSLFKVPSALVIAQRDLEAAKRDLLTVHATSEHAAKMVEYYEGVVSRLSSYIQTETRPTGINNK